MNYITDDLYSVSLTPDVGLTSAHGSRERDR